MAGLWKFLPCASCCEECDDPTCCNTEAEPQTCPCSCGAPDEFALTFAGFVNTVDCDQCETFNDTFVLTKQPPPSPNTHCIWQYISPDPSCGGFDLTWSVLIAAELAGVWSADSNPYSIGVWGGFATSVWTQFFYKQYAEAFDCTALSGVDIPLLGSYYPFCDGSSATCSITAL